LKTLEEKLFVIVGDTSTPEHRRIVVGHRSISRPLGTFVSS
jgi:hypothetical protein